MSLEDLKNNQFSRLKIELQQHDHAKNVMKRTWSDICQRVVAYLELVGGDSVVIGGERLIHKNNVITREPVVAVDIAAEVAAEVASEVDPKLKKKSVK